MFSGRQSELVHEFWFTVSLAQKGHQYFTESRIKQITDYVRLKIETLTRSSRQSVRLVARTASNASQPGKIDEMITVYKCEPV